MGSLAVLPCCVTRLCDWALLLESTRQVSYAIVLLNRDGTHSFGNCDRFRVGCAARGLHRHQLGDVSLHAVSYTHLTLPTKRIV